MATLLCHIEIHPDKVVEFEAVIKEMYHRTHAEEPNCIRYEYFRAAQPNKYYTLLSFTDRISFLQHQISDYHEGFDFAAMIKSIEMEWVDPVNDAAPLGATNADDLPDGTSDLVKQAADTYIIQVQQWWQQYR